MSLSSKILFFGLMTALSIFNLLLPSIKLTNKREIQACFYDLEGKPTQVQDEVIANLIHMNSRHEFHKCLKELFDAEISFLAHLSECLKRYYDCYEKPIDKNEVDRISRRLLKS